MPDNIYGLGLLVGTQVKVIGFSTYPLSDKEPGPPIRRMRDDFDLGYNEARKYGGLAKSPAKICRFIVPAEAARGQDWLAAEKVEMVKVYDDFKKKAAA